MMYNNQLVQTCDNCGNDTSACEHCCAHSAWIPHNFAIINESGTFKLNIAKVLKSVAFRRLAIKFKGIKK